MKNLNFFIIIFLMFDCSISYSQIGVGISNDPTFNNPQSPLHIYITSDGNLLQLSRSAFPNTGLIFSVNNNDYSIINKQNYSLILGTNNTERMRVLNTGQILVNTTNPVYPQDLFGALTNSTYTDAINGYSNQSDGNGIVGVNTTATGNGLGCGVYGQSYQTGGAGVYGNGGSYTRGILGYNNSALYAAIHAQNDHNNGDALFAINNAAQGIGGGTAIWATSNQTGASTICANLVSNVYFSNAAISASVDANLNNARGIIAQSNNSSGIAIQGQTSGTQGIGVLGINSSTTANYNAIGVWGQSSNPNGVAGYFYNNATSGSNEGDGVDAYTSQSAGFSIYAFHLNTNGTAILAGGNNVSSVYYPTNGCGGAFNGSTLGIYGSKVGAYTSGAGAAAFIASSDANTGVYVAYRSGSTNYKIIDISGFGGSVSTDVLGENGLKDARIMFAPEATEIFLQDFGRAQLTNGRAYVKLDPIFAKNIIVNEKYPLHVYIQLEGDCNGVYVTNKSNEGFEVIELQGGTSNVSFTYFVNGHRRDYINPETGELISKHEGVRLPLAPKAPEISSRPANLRLNKFNNLILEPKIKKEIPNLKEIKTKSK